MTAPMPPPAAKDPMRPTRLPLLPPGFRSRAALGLAAAAAVGRFALQVCDACGTTLYPPREVCNRCLGTSLSWRAVSPWGRVVAETTVRVSADPYFRSRMPWRIGTVVLECGPSVVAHLHGDVAAGQRTRLTLRLDRSGQGVMMAMPEQDTPNMQDDRQLREMTCDPRGRRVLVTDGRSAFGQSLAAALLDARAATVFVGIADAWRPFAGQDRVIGERVPLDLTDGESVGRMAAAFGGRIDVVVNTGLQLRPGDVLGRSDLVTAREEMEAAYFGPLRLAQALGPALRFRGADGTHPACAWVNVVSVAALAPLPGYHAAAASQAAGLSLALSLRDELRPVRVLNAFVGPLDDEWHQAIPPPKVTPAALSAAVMRGLRDGLEEVAVGDVALDVMARWNDNPATLARDLAGR